MAKLRAKIFKSGREQKWYVSYYYEGDFMSFVGLSFNSWQNAYNFCCGTWWYMDGTATDSDKRETIIWTKKLWTGEL